MTQKSLKIIELLDMFPDEEAARKWFEDVRWGDYGRACPHCGGTETTCTPHEKPLPYWCPDCREYFSVRTKSVMHRSKLPLRKWAIAIFLLTTSPKGIPSTRLARYLGVTQRTAWHISQKIRKGWMQNGATMAGSVEVDETYIGGRERNKHFNKKLKRGSGYIGKTAVIGMKDRETNRMTAEVARVNDEWGAKWDKPTSPYRAPQYRAPRY